MFGPEGSKIQNEFSEEAETGTVERVPELELNELGEEEEKTLESETGITRTVLEKIRDNKMLRRLFKALVLSVGLFAGERAFSQGAGSGEHSAQEVVQERFAGIEQLRSVEGAQMLKELLGDLIKNKDMDLKFKQEPSLYEKEGISAAFIPESHNNLSSTYRCTVEWVPFEQLDDQDKSSFLSTIYHEVVHASQDYELWNYASRGNPKHMPEWKAKFYAAKLSDKQKDVHLGAELEAYYEQALFEKKGNGRIERSTLAGFFIYCMKIKRSDDLRKYEEVRQEVDRQYKEIVKASGQTLESFIESRK